MFSTVVCICPCACAGVCHPVISSPSWGLLLGWIGVGESTVAQNQPTQDWYTSSSPILDSSSSSFSVTPKIQYHIHIECFISFHLILVWVICQQIPIINNNNNNNNNNEAPLVAVVVSASWNLECLCAVGTSKVRKNDG
jgi:hypothetical protein